MLNFNHKYRKMHKISHIILALFLHLFIIFGLHSISSNSDANGFNHFSRYSTDFKTFQLVLCSHYFLVDPLRQRHHHHWNAL